MTGAQPRRRWAGLIGAFVATFACSLVALCGMHEGAVGVFVPQHAVSMGLLLAFAGLGTLIRFLHHVATTIGLDREVALRALASATRDDAAALAARGAAPPRPCRVGRARGDRGGGAFQRAAAIRMPRTGCRLVPPLRGRRLPGRPRSARRAPWAKGVRAISRRPRLPEHDTVTVGAAPVHNADNRVLWHRHGLDCRGDIA